MTSFLRIGARVLTGALALVCLAAIALLVLDSPNRPPAFDRAAALERARTYHVRIRRDDFGVPHVKGARDADVAFGIAYAHAEDDYRTIETVLLATRGTLAARDGLKAATTDYLVQLMRIWPAVRRDYPGLPADLRAVLEAYADGVNAYGAAHPDQVSAGVLPVTGPDIAAGFAFKTPFFYGLDKTLSGLMAPQPHKPPAPTGSNGLAVAPSRSADGATRLLVNSHQPYTGPVAWYEAVLESGEGWHVAGGFFPGSPFMLHGHNAHLGWANTVNAPALSDVYRLEINPADKSAYRLDGAWRKLEAEPARLRIKLFGPLYLNVTKDMFFSAHGPVLKTDHGVFAVRYAGRDEGRQALQYYRLDKANTLAEWRAAMALQLLPSINYIYADEAGNIGYVYNAQFPARKEKDADAAPQKELPGDRSDLIWTSYLPFDQVPQIWNPRCGLVFNSNNTPFVATACADDGLDPKRIPKSLGVQTNMTNRAMRAQETFGADPAITAERFRAYKFDLTYSERSKVVQIVRGLTAIDPHGDASLAEAQGVLRKWDRRMDVHNRSAALVALTTAPMTMAEMNHAPPPDSLTSLKAAAAELKRHFGRLDPEWGQLNRIRRGAVDLPIDGGPDTYRSVWGRPQPDGTLTADAGDTFIMFVTWDRQGRLSSESVHQFGSATLDARSPHFADQTPLFVGMKTKPVWFTETQLAGHIRSDYAP
eukprot:gene12193-12278_t